MTAPGARTDATEARGCPGAMAAAEAPRERCPRARRRWLFWRVHQRWKLLGVFEIDPEHEFYGLTCHLRAGLGAATQEAIDHPPADVPGEGDCVAVLKQPHEGFELRTYAAPAFARLRRSLGLAEEEYQASLSSRGPYLQFISNSKSPADFFLTHDKRFFLKTQNKREIRFLLSNLPRYLRHLERYPHSLLVRFLGVHSIILPRRRKKYFIIMQSVFYPDERILERYDIKGCWVNRRAEPAAEGSPAVVVLKDCNFEGKTIALGAQRAWLLRQLELDSRFLEELRVLDYSLLLALQPLHADERRPPGLALAGLVARAAQSVEQSGSSWSAAGAAGSTDPACEPGARAAAQHRRLLPASRNPLHVLDGPQLRYFVGIIDLFTVYGCRKRLEHLWKSIRYRGQSFSTVCPAEYARRLCRWVETHTL
ncbi:phosphatidylinositol 4-phosphate 5-kinase-like protein 1 isoform X2 [Apteryx mantelli]|uniref:Phosphatidylinositol 4-phosphate 5-kinase-like protein 1 isoform X2 n=1 Tax=Apteryx mantelli TaxID=2696672 RepID=A0ABM4FJM8_9AVES